MTNFAKYGLDPELKSFFSWTHIFLLWDLNYVKKPRKFRKPCSIFLCSQNQAGSDLSKFEEDSDDEEHYEDVKDEDVKDEDVKDGDVKDKDEGDEEDSDKVTS